MRDTRTAYAAPERMLGLPSGLRIGFMRKSRLSKTPGMRSVQEILQNRLGALVNRRKTAQKAGRCERKEKLLAFKKKTVLVLECKPSPRSHLYPNSYLPACSGRTDQSIQHPNHMHDPHCRSFRELACRRRKLQGGAPEALQEVFTSRRPMSLFRPARDASEALQEPCHA